VALLFHGTKGPKGVERVLREGLDDRLGSGGLMGRGIYFSDSPLKAKFYDRNETLMLFMVHLGDCLKIIPSKETMSYVREPGKTAEQQRNSKDEFFDSVAGRNGTEGSNEFVIYNRAYCYPLYTITYENESSAPPAPVAPPPVLAPTDPYTLARASLPSSFLWTERNVLSSQGTNSPVEWPFLAQSIFERMENYAAQVVPAVLRPSPSSLITDESIAQEMRTLAELGFLDSETNSKLLKKFGRNLEMTVHFLLEGDQAPAPAAPPQNPGPSRRQSGTGTGNSAAAAAAASGIVPPVAPVKVNVKGVPAASTSTSTSIAGAPPVAAVGTTGILVPVFVDLTLSPPREKRARLSSTTAPAPPPAPPPIPSSSTSTDTGAAPAVAAVGQDEDEGCPICCTDYPTTPEHWEVS
jgi:hypothetical protein